ncbi:G-type lectin S-receptor-like serine/threonine-protein kinase LECRK3 [Humulus lupulus]|uniref:G-type lectin S-receptor-like serine/threonine-protein kinase LECRK3 n=1 Tax=Humulus lupulus TaxID=3486 RepID=UPI002B40CA21|nr:G-type lectin S-receptor-like serine/threonine-protein kinase LECRK3 [Humulus lupulus]
MAVVFHLGLLPITLLLLPFSVVLAQFAGLVLIDSLTAGDKDAWLSPTKDFAFGFRRLNNDDYDLDHNELYLLAIWYNKLADQTIVWHANGVSVPRGSTLELISQTGLVLTNSHGDQVWSSSDSKGDAHVSRGLMKDTGNFVLLDENNKAIWESFKHPTNTLLPTQTMVIGDMLFSHQSLTNFSPGRFQFGLYEDGDVVLNFTNFPDSSPSIAYFKMGFSGADKVTFDAQGRLYLSSSDRKICIAKSDDAVSPSKYYLKVTLHFHGVLALSYFPKKHNEKSIWKVKKAIPDDICNDLTVPGNMGTGPCGYNSICTLEDGTPQCKCPPGYSSLSQTRNYSGCIPDFPQLWDDNNDGKISVVELPRTDWPESDYEFIESSELEECKNNCLLDRYCAGGTFNFNTNRCWKKRLPLSNGRESKKLKNMMGFIIVKTPPHISSNKAHKIILTLLFILLGGSLLINFVVLTRVYLASELNCRKVIRSYRKYHGNSVIANLRQFSYKELSEATNGFTVELGRGSCGVVFKGQIKSGIVAVKLLKRLFQENDREFQVEVNIICKTHQKNLVRLVGYCNERKHRLLVYEYMSNGTLANFLFKGPNNPRPSWSRRTDIAIGIARGLLYLHEDCSTQIMHCDMKPQNVLLDDSYNARISDFGMAKILGLSQTHSYCNNSIRGTKGYIAPEWFRSAAPITARVDVYSFGVMLLEIVSCRRNDNVLNECGGGGETGFLIDWAYECYNNERVEGLVENDIEAMAEVEMVERFVKVALWCLQEDPSQRPSMKKVLLMLEGIVVVSAPPSSPCSSSSSNT